MVTESNFLNSNPVWEQPKAHFRQQPPFLIVVELEVVVKVWLLAEDAAHMHRKDSTGP